MKVGDRVRHRKYGVGTVKAVYTKYAAARVLYDDGHESTNVQKKLQILTESQAKIYDTSRPRAVEAQPVKRRGVSSSGVDYDLVERTREAASEAHPNADNVTGKWYGGRAYAEVWKDGHAQLVFQEALGIS